MDTQIKIDDSKVMRMLDRLSRAAEDMSPAMVEIAEVLRDASERAFQNEQDPETGNKWEPLAPSTIKRRQKKGKWPGSILQQSGRLAASVQSEHGKDYAAAGTNAQYAAIHQFGGTIHKKARTGTHSLRTDAKGNLLRQQDHDHLAVFAKKRHKRRSLRAFVVPAHDIEIPARPFLGVGQRDLDDITGILLRHIDSALK